VCVCVCVCVCVFGSLRGAIELLQPIKLNYPQISCMT
jgi:hypothetical protein